MFITFEGGDGSGKTTQIQILKDSLVQKGCRVLLTREPGGTPIGEKIRRILLDKKNSEMCAVSEVMLYAAARAQLVEELIRPALKDGKVVICDRFLDSSIAYQGFGRNLGSIVEEINSYGVGDCVPDLTIYLKLDPQKGSGRIESRKKDRMELESGDFHKRVSDGYDHLTKACPDRILTIDASGSIEDIANEIERAVMERLDET